MANKRVMLNLVAMQGRGPEFFEESNNSRDLKILDLEVSGMRKVIADMRAWAKVQQGRVAVLEHKLEALERLVRSVVPPKT